MLMFTVNHHYYVLLLLFIVIYVLLNGKPSYRYCCRYLYNQQYEKKGKLKLKYFEKNTEKIKINWQEKSGLNYSSRTETSYIHRDGVC